jgi:hypothetical protein
MKLQRRVGADSRFKMDKDFIDDDDSDEDADINEFEKFQVPTGPHVPVPLTGSLSNRAALVSNVDEEVDTALDALRSVLGSGHAGGGSARDVKDPLKKTKKQKREQNKSASVGGARDFKNDMTRYDPENQRSIQKFDLDVRKEAANEVAALRAAAAAAAEEEEDNDTTGSSASSLLFHHEQNGGNVVDPSKRYYASKTNFWTDLYESTKGRKDVIALKASSAEFRLTDLGLDKQFGVGDGSGGGGGGGGSGGGGGFSFGFGNGEMQETMDDKATQMAVDTGTTSSEVVGASAGAAAAATTTIGVAPTIQVAFLPFVKEGTDYDARKWWEENRIRLTDLYRKNHRDVLRGRRAKQRANTSSWK